MGSTSVENVLIIQLMIDRIILVSVGVPLTKFKVIMGVSARLVIIKFMEIV